MTKRDFNQYLQYSDILIILSVCPDKEFLEKELDIKISIYTTEL